MSKYFDKSASTFAVFSFFTATACAMTIREFQKFSTTDQSTYIGAAVSMLAYSNAANGDVPKARCIQGWYFGKKGAETPGPREITIELGVAENLCADKCHVEGVILGATDKACPAGSSQSKPKP